MTLETEKLEVFDRLVEDLINNSMLPKIMATAMLNKIYMTLEARGVKK